MSDGLRVVELRVNDFMGIKLAEIRPDGDVVVIGGRNGQGKTSLLNAIECAIRGKAFHPDKPVRDGEDQGEVVLDLGELQIRRRFKADGSGTITVSTPDGMRPQRPQELLDALAGAIAFDPLEFSRFDAKERLAFVRELSGVDVSDLELERANTFDERTIVNRTSKQLRGQLAGMTFHKAAPKEEMSVSELVTEREGVRNRIQEQDETKREISRLTREVETLEETRDELAHRLEQTNKDLLAAGSDCLGLKKKCDGFTDHSPELARLDTSIGTAEETNRTVRENASYGQTRTAVSQSEKKSETLSKRLNDLETEKAERMAAASLPIDGLSFGEDGVTLNGIPFDQISGAERLQASVGMGMALNPKLHVMLIRDGSLLDEESMELLAQMAAKHGYQCWVERVGTSDARAIVIEDGEVVSAAQAEGEAA